MFTLVITVTQGSCCLADCKSDYGKCKTPVSEQDQWQKHLQQVLASTLQSLLGMPLQTQSMLKDSR